MKRESETKVPSMDELTDKLLQQHLIYNRALSRAVGVLAASGEYGALYYLMRKEHHGICAGDLASLL